MKKMTKLSALLAVAAAAPAVVAPNLVAPAQAQDAARAEFQDVPRDHWAYDALQRLAAAGVIEGYPPSGDFRGQRAMTRYEFAVAIARLLNRIPAVGAEVDLTTINRRLTDLEGRPIPDVTMAQVTDMIAALRREFADELARLGAQVDALNTRVTTIENRVTPAPRLTITPSILHHTGYANYINNGTNPPFTGRSFLNPLQGRGNPLAFNQQLAPGAAPTITVFPNVAINGQPLPPFTFGGGTFGDVTPFATTPREPNAASDRANKKFSYTDFEIRMTDRVSDRLSLNAAIRSLGSNQEDPWAGDSQANVYVREAYASADLSDRGFLGTRGLSTTLGRQRTKIAQGLLYDNDLSPTDQLRLDFNVGPVALSGFIGTSNNVTGLGPIGLDPYVTQGSVFFLNTGFAGGGTNRVVGFPQFGIGPVAGGVGGLGFAADFNPFVADDNETLYRASLNLFRLAGQPVNLGYSRLASGFRQQKGDSFDLTLPLFNRTVGFEYVRQTRDALGRNPENFDAVNGTNGGDARAYIATVPVLRTGILDLNFAYGSASNNFEYNVISSANPYARSYGQAIFDRPMALGAPLMFADANGQNGGFVAAKRTVDFNGTVRLPLGFLRRVPLDFRYYTADSGSNAFGPGTGRVDLGRVYSIGTTFNVTPGLDLNIMGGNYSPDSNALPEVRYVRVGASVGF